MSIRVLMTGADSGSGVTIAKNIRDLSPAIELVTIGLSGSTIRCDFSGHYTDEYFPNFLRQHEQFDILLNHAGVIHNAFMHKHRVSDFEYVLRTNLVTPFLLTKAFVAKAMDTNRGIKPRVVTTTSMAIKTPPRACPGYSASKAGLDAMMRGWARELAGEVLFFNVAPCAIESTVMQVEGLVHLRTRGMTSEQAHNYQRANPLSRMATHDEIWKVIKFAMFDAPEIMTSTTLYVPGATTIC